MAVRVLALAFVIAEIVAGGETRLHGDFVHGVCSILRGNAARTFYFSGDRLASRLADRAAALAPRRLAAPLRCAGRPAQRDWLRTPTSAKPAPQSRRRARWCATASRWPASRAESSKAPATCRPRCSAKKPQRGGENVEVAGHRCGRACCDLSLQRFYGVRRSCRKLGGIDDGDAGFGELRFHRGHGSVEVDGAAGVAEDEGGAAEPARVESGVGDAIVIGEAGEEDAREAALAQIAGQTGGRGAVVLKECRIGIDLRAEAFAQNQLGLRRWSAG